MAKGVGFINEDWFTIKTGKELIYESIIRILMTTPGERVMRRDFGVGLNRKLFSLATPDLLQDLAVSIHSSLDRYEDRATVIDVQTELIDDNVIKIHIFMEKETDPDDVEELTLKYNLSSE